MKRKTHKEDEGLLSHHFRHHGSTQTERFLRYMKDHPECRFAALSGTMAAKSIRDYAPLIELAARLELLVSALDYGADVHHKANAVALARSRDGLLKAARGYFKKSLPGLRLALRTATRPKKGHKEGGR